MVPKPTIPQLPELADAVAASTAFDQALAALKAAEEVLADVAGRRDALVQRGADHNANRPVAPAKFDASDIAALIADPLADPLAQRGTQSGDDEDAYRRDLSDWEARAEVIQQAIGQTGDAVAEAEGLVADALRIGIARGLPFYGRHTLT